MAKRIGKGYSFREQTIEKENEELKKQINELNLKLRKILNPKAPSKSIAYKLFIAKAQELFELSDWKGEYRDL